MKRINSKRIGLLMAGITAMLMSCAPQLDNTPPPYEDVRYADRMMYVTSSFRVYAPIIDRARVERIAMDVYGVRSVSWSPGSSIMTVQYYPGRTNTQLIQQVIARAGYDTSAYRAVSMRPVTLPARPAVSTRQPVTVPRTQYPVNVQQPPRNNNTQSHGSVNTQPRTSQQPRTTQSTQPQTTQSTQPRTVQQPQTPVQSNTQQNNPQNNSQTTTSGGHFGGKRN